MSCGFFRGRPRGFSGGNTSHAGIDPLAARVRRCTAACCLRVIASNSLICKGMMRFESSHPDQISKKPNQRKLIRLFALGRRPAIAPVYCSLLPACPRPRAGRVAPLSHKRQRARSLALQKVTPAANCPDPGPMPPSIPPHSTAPLFVCPNARTMHSHSISP